MLPSTKQLVTCTLRYTMFKSLTHLTSSDTCVINAEIDDASGILLSVGSSIPSDDAALDSESPTSTEFEDFSTIALD